MSIQTANKTQSLRLRFLLGLGIILLPSLILTFGAIRSLNYSVGSLNSVLVESVEELGPLQQTIHDLEHLDEVCDKYSVDSAEWQIEGPRLLNQCRLGFSDLEKARYDSQYEREQLQAAIRQWRAARGFLQATLNRHSSNPQETTWQRRQGGIHLDHSIDTLTRLMGVIQREIESKRRSALNTQAYALTTIISTYVLGLLLTLITGVLLTRSAVVPLAAIEAGANRFGSGELSYRIPAGLPGEFGRLATAFNDMAAGLEHQNAERERIESELRAAQSELESRVQARTHELAKSNRQLEAARIEADRANNEKSLFLSRMSHELRTPLNAIIGFGQVMEMQSLPRKQEECIHHILKAGRHLLGLVNEVLDIARIEAGELSLSLEPVPVLLHMREVADLAQPLAASRRIQFDLQAEDVQQCHAMADQQRLKQVLFNLVSNAIKYNRTGGHITFAATKSGEDRLRISVTDTGLGIPPEQREKLFLPFERLGAESSDVEGTGLGLSLSRHLIQLMNGKIGVESTPEVGSTFWIELALAAAPEEVLAKRGDAVVPALSSPAPSRETKAVVLYVEDNLSNLKLVERILEQYPQIRLITAMQGRHGFELASRHQPDLILLDLHLPDMMGAQVLQQLQGDERTRQIPVVVLSADATAKQIERLLAAGATDYLTKPLDVKHFISVLERTLESRES